ncbi:MAG TPA: PAS domain S-box protein [Anaerolineales bacterium]|nr:PAS domain S-box protein [Anaerolineales bacterium]
MKTNQKVIIKRNSGETQKKGGNQKTTPRLSTIKRQQFEEALRESEDKFKYVFDYSAEGKSIALPSGEVQVNKAFCEMLGYSVEEVQNKKWRDFTHPDDIELTQREIDAVLSGEKEAARFTKRYLHKNGSIVWVDVITSARRDKQGKPLYLMTSLTDSTRQKHAELLMARQAALLDLAHDAIFVRNMQSKIVFWNRGAERTYGWTKAEASNQVKHILLHTVFPDSLEAVDEALRVEGEWEGELTHTRRDGVQIVVDSRQVLQRDEQGQSIGILEINRDVTERKQAEQEIQELNAKLEERVIQRTAQLESANKELEAFAYSVSHDLRAPLRAITGYANILLEDYEPSLDAEGKRVCGVISSEAKRMGKLIDDLLTFSRLSRTEKRDSQIDMQAMMQSVFHELTTPESRARIDLQVGELPAAIGDPGLMRQVWVNLLSNALKFSSKREQAVIEVGSTQGRDETIYSVRDNGVGFDMQYAGKLFGVFQRLHSEREFEGTGVGLAIVQRVILRHGGRVWGEGYANHGAVFYFALPREEEPNG